MCKNETLCGFDGGRGQNEVEGIRADFMEEVALELGLEG